eukprot:8466656-Pyramimonas_sp.AAC.1
MERRVPPSRPPSTPLSLMPPPLTPFPSPAHSYPPCLCHSLVPLFPRPMPPSTLPQPFISDSWAHPVSPVGGQPPAAVQDHERDGHERFIPDSHPDPGAPTHSLRSAVAESRCVAPPARGR